jgi:hypothetical protein
MNVRTKVPVISSVAALLALKAYSAKALEDEDVNNTSL